MSIPRRWVLGAALLLARRAATGLGAPVSPLILLALLLLASRKMAPIAPEARR